MRPLLQNFAAKAETVDLERAMCFDQCRLFDAHGKLIFLDAAHLTKAGASFLAINMRKAYPALF